MRPSLAMSCLMLLASGSAAGAATPADDALFTTAAQNGERTEEVFRRTRRLMHAWLAYADERTLLLPDVIPGFKRGPQATRRLPSPQLGRRQLPVPRGHRLLHRPAALRRPHARHAAQRDPLHERGGRHSRQPRPPEREARSEEPFRRRRIRQGRPPGHHRAAGANALVLPDGGHDRGGDGARSDGERLRPAARRGGGAERRRAAGAGAPRHHDGRQALSRMGGADRRRLRARGVAPEPRPARLHWDFTKHEGPDRMRLRDHGNEIVVGLSLLQALESDLGRPRGESYRAPVAKMLDRILASANPDGLLYDDIRASDLQADADHASRTTGATSTAPSTRTSWPPARPAIREAVRRVLREPAKLPRPRLGARQPRRLRRRHRERALPRWPAKTCRRRSPSSRAR